MIICKSTVQLQLDGVDGPGYVLTLVYLYRSFIQSFFIWYFYLTVQFISDLLFHLGIHSKRFRPTAEFTFILFIFFFSLLVYVLVLGAFHTNFLVIFHFKQMQ